jgi:hypothetical protein
MMTKKNLKLENCDEKKIDVIFYYIFVSVFVLPPPNTTFSPKFLQVEAREFSSVS